MNRFGAVAKREVFSIIWSLLSRNNLQRRASLLYRSDRRSRLAYNCVVYFGSVLGKLTSCREVQLTTVSTHKHSTGQSCLDAAMALSACKKAQLPLAKGRVLLSSGPLHLNLSGRTWSSRCRSRRIGPPSQRAPEVSMLGFANR